jgi:hypothetical protein
MVYSGASSGIASPFEQNQGDLTMAYNFTKTIQVKQWSIQIDPVKQYGSFESENTGNGGGLWFENNTLIDYDGVFELSKSVIQGIEQLGFNADYAKDET